MPITFRVSPEHRLVETVLTGDPTLEDINAYRQELARTAGYEPAFDALVDARGISSLPQSSDIRTLAGQARVRDASTSNRCAIVTGEDVVYGTVRLFEAHAQGSPTQYFAARTLAEALDWLGIELSILRLVDTEQPHVPGPRHESPARTAQSAPRHESDEAGSNGT